MEAATLRGLQRVSMALTDDPKVVLESSDIIFSLVNDPNWYLESDEISPTLILNDHGAILDLKNKNGHTPLGSAVEQQCEIIKLLEKAINRVEE